MEERSCREVLRASARRRARRTDLGRRDMLAQRGRTCGDDGSGADDREAGRQFRTLCGTEVDSSLSRIDDNFGRWAAKQYVDRVQDISPEDAFLTDEVGLQLARKLLSIQEDPDLK